MIKVWVEHEDGTAVDELGEFMADELDALVEAFQKFGARMQIGDDFPACKFVGACFQPADQRFVIIVGEE